MPVVSHRLLRPGGAAMADETVHIRLLASTVGEAEGFVASTQTGILSEHKTRTDSTGTWSVTLVANALITPANTVYQVIQPGLAGGKVTEHFIVPNGAGPYWLGDILAEAPGTLASAALSLHEAAADPHPAYLTAPEADAAYAPVPTTVTTNTAQLITGLKTVSPSSASAVGLIIQGVVGQNGDLLSLRNSASTVLAKFGSTGALTLPGAGMQLIDANGPSIVSPNNDGSLRFYPGSGKAQSGMVEFNGTAAFRLIGAAIVYHSNPASNASAPYGYQVDFSNDISHGSAYALRVRNNVTAGAQDTFNVRPHGMVTSAVVLPTEVPLTLRGATLQSAGLLIVQDSTLTTVASISAAGRIAATFAEGFRTFELAGLDSGGTGFRAVRVPN